MRGSTAVIPDTLLGATVTKGAVSWRLERPIVDHRLPAGGRVMMDRERALIEIPELGAFSVEHGEQVLFAPAPGAHSGDIEAYLYATVTALLLAQRGRFALHATLVRVGGTDIGLAGPTTAGKSTTALRLRQRGHELICDDVVPVELEAAAAWHVPMARPVRIAAATADALGLDVAGAPSPGPCATKLALHHDQQRRGRLDRVIVLQQHSQNEVESFALDAIAAVPLMQRNTYRQQLLAPWRRELFAWAAGLAERVPMSVLRRPRLGWTIDQVADEIERIADGSVSWRA